MAGPTIKGDLQLDGFTVSSVSGDNNQVLTLDSAGIATWAASQGGAAVPNQLPCFFRYFVGYGIPVPANLYKNNNNKLDARTYDYVSDGMGGLEFKYTDIGTKDITVETDNTILTRNYDYVEDDMGNFSFEYVTEEIKLRV